MQGDIDIDIFEIVLGGTTQFDVTDLMVFYDGGISQR